MEPSLRASLTTLLREIVEGPQGEVAYVLNQGDPGLLASLDRLPAATASAQPGGRSSIAAHVDHLRYGIELLNRWSRGDNPWPTANYAASWRRQLVSEAEWESLRRALRRETREWMSAIAQPRELDEEALSGVVASIVHLAYHLGAIRQLAAAAAGPQARD